MAVCPARARSAATPTSHLYNTIPLHGNRVVTGMDIYDDFRTFYEKNPNGIYLGPGKQGGEYASHPVERWHPAAATVKPKQSPSPLHATCMPWRLLSTWGCRQSHVG